MHSCKFILKRTQLVIPKNLQQKVLELVHEHHLGFVKTKQLLKTKTWWPTMNKDTEESVTTGISCQMVCDGSWYEPMKLSALPDGPWQSLYMDMLGSYSTGESILVITNRYS